MMTIACSPRFLLAGFLSMPGAAVVMAVVVVVVVVVMVMVNFP